MIAIGTGMDPLVGLNCHWALAELAGGHPDRAQALTDEVWAATQAEQVNAKAYALYHIGLVLALARGSARAETLATGLDALARAHGLLFWEAMAGFLVALSRLELGDAADAIEWLSRSLPAAERTGSGLQGALCRSVLAEALAVTGDAAAFTMAETAEALAHRSGALYGLAEIQRRQGVVLRLLRPAATAEAEAAFRRALATAAEQKARLWELRAASELARLLAGQGRHQQALDLLAPVYGWFTEGFDTLDLLEAKALLEELHGG